jgi:hypothetical protein
VQRKGKDENRPTLKSKNNIGHQKEQGKLFQNGSGYQKQKDQ